MISSNRTSVWSLRLGPQRGGAGRVGAGATWAGVLYTMAVMVILLAALNANVNLLFMVVGFSGGVLLVSVLAAGAATRKLQVTRQAPDAVIAGRPFTVRYRVSNERAFGAAYALRIREKVSFDGHALRVEGYVAAVAAGSTVTLDVTMTAPGRGHLHFETIRLATRFPFGLFERRLRVAARHETIVYPRLLQLRRSFAGRRTRAAAAALSAREEKHGNDEFYGLREYRPGDNLRRIHWRSSARTGQLLVRELTDLRPQSVIVVLDVNLAGGAEPRQRELAISAAATVVCHALEQGYRLGLIVLSRNPVVIAPGAGRGLRARLLGQLTAIDSSSPPSAARFLRGMRWRGRWRGRCLLIAAGGYDGLWEAANVLRPNVASVETIIANTPEFSTAWFAGTGERGPLGGASGPQTSPARAKPATTADAARDERRRVEVEA